MDNKEAWFPVGYQEKEVTVNGERTAVKLVHRDTRVKQHCDEQLKLYSPCSCGSGKKFKFCCKGKQMVVIDTGA